MKVTFNENKELVAKVQEGLKRTGGYCPCRLERTPDTKCMCKEFRDQIADPKYEGYIHAAGMVLLLALMVYVMFNDIIRIVTG